MDGWNLEARLGLSVSDAQILYALGSLLLTLVLIGVTIWYALSTGRVVRDIRRQNRPYVFIAGEVDLMQLVPFRLVVRNTGNRVAQNIHVKVNRDAYIWQFRMLGELPPEERYPVSSLALVSKGGLSLAPNEARPLGFVPKDHFLSGEDQLFEYTVTYQDSAGAKYSEEFSLSYKA